MHTVLSGSGASGVGVWEISSMQKKNDYRTLKVEILENIGLFPT